MSWPTSRCRSCTTVAPPWCAKLVISRPPSNRCRFRRQRHRCHRRPAGDPRFAERMQQRVGHPAVRSRGAGGQRRETAGGGTGRRAFRRRRCPTESRLVERPRDLERHESPVRRFRPVLDGGQRDRRSGAELRGGWGRSVPDRDPRQLLLGEDRPSGNAGIARSRGPRLSGIAIAYGTPFISGKDSLNNEFLYKRDGEQKVISIPGSLLISALGIVPDLRRCVTMDLKRPGNRLFLVGATRDELGGSHFALVRGLSGGNVPQVDTESAPKIFAAVHRAISAGRVRACHDLSEGGLAAALAEMCFAGEFGARVSLKALSAVPGVPADPVRQLFSESNTRFVLEAAPEKRGGPDDRIRGPAVRRTRRSDRHPRTRRDRRR